MVVPAGTHLYRVARPEFGIGLRRSAPFWGGGGRFDCEDGTFGYEWLADHPGVCMAEVCCRTIPPRPHISTMASAELSGLVLLTVRTRVDVGVHRVHGSALRRLGHTVDITKRLPGLGSPVDGRPEGYRESRDLAARIVAKGGPERGIRYRPRHDEDHFAHLLYQRLETGREDDDLGELIELVDDLALDSREGVQVARRLLAEYWVAVEAPRD